MRRPSTGLVAVALAVSLLGGLAFVVVNRVFAPMTITAHFTSATAIYPGDEVRVAGVRVGTIERIDTGADSVRMTLSIERGHRIPAEAHAVIVPQNLISARYVQLTPAYVDEGPTLADGDEIPVERTAVPVEWDEVKTQLMRLATELGPDEDPSTSALGRLIDTAATAMDGNGAKLRRTLTELSGAARIFADTSTDVAEIVVALETFVSALEHSTTQIAEFENRLASLTGVVDASRSDLDTALREIAAAVGIVQRFVAGSRQQTSEQVQRLANVTQSLVDQRPALENLLHGAPTAFANFYNMYNPDTGTVVGTFALQNFSNPVQFICSAIGSVHNATAPETAKLCSQYLGPALAAMDFNYLPFPINPFLGPSARPEHIVYSPAELDPAVGGPPPGPADLPPAVSAYTGEAHGPPPPGPAGGEPATTDGLLLPDVPPLPAEEGP
ncbi:MCE family protein [Mycolicibacterium thermoresistibile]|uniref:Virulence factor mce family protein n=2 Tax=Mycolicibacterium thermoresistibile TaxID=1797 RepID=G7CN07_MYCT3|nr:MCE family protein [Mycolicibacterium thermoresistibile]EHI10496.1 virulence factor mce family protein [Mycolicibacterium thermoresistibile ATCC 19527]MCV7189635.1 MCE family protein [Mycolicibacterium thermoresistibile]GAT15452.1 virulence factor Mce family protein [Mycolicibacterium thermoresistibile]SNW17511.1 virulence factor Mce family protein [Mycolicibacterium thermoresistibile]